MSEYSNDLQIIKGLILHLQTLKIATYIKTHKSVFINDRFKTIFDRLPMTLLMVAETYSLSDAIHMHFAFNNCIFDLKNCIDYLNRVLTYTVEKPKYYFWTITETIRDEKASELILQFQNYLYTIKSLEAVQNIVKVREEKLEAFIKT